MTITYKTFRDPARWRDVTIGYDEQGNIVSDSRLEDHTMEGSGMARSFNLNAQEVPQTFDSDLAVSKDVKFTRQQLAYLETVFPEVLEVGLTEADLRTRVGQRIVLAHIKNRVSG